MLNYGRTLASGTPDQVLNDTKVVEAYLGVRGGNSGYFGLRKPYLRFLRPPVMILVRAKWRCEMAVEAAGGPMQGKLVVRDVGLLLSGDLAQPILDADTIVAIDGLIAAVGTAKDVDTDKPDLVVDAKGCAVAPGLIDSHCHPVFGDWTRGRTSWAGSTRA